MYRIICKSKIQKARITRTDLYYEGSIGIDKNIIEAGNILPNEMVQVLNLHNGARFQTYVIEEPSDSGSIILYGPAARMGQPGDLLIIISQAMMRSKEIQRFKPKVVYLDNSNRILKK